jgi:HK97 family phage prohead protease
MTEHLTRANQADLDIRDGRTVVGIAMPFNREAVVSDDGQREYTESFVRGSFARTIAERGSRIRFFYMHQRMSLPLGKATLLREDSAGLYGEFRVSATPSGDEALELIKDGTLDGLSVSFDPISGRSEWSYDRTSVRRMEVKLMEVSAVWCPAYADAVITDVRSEVGDHRPFSVDDARRRLAILQRRITP